MGLVSHTHELEGVGPVAVPGRVYLRVEDTEADRAEVAADSSEQVALIADIDHGLQSFDGGRQPRLDDRLLAARARVQYTSVPGDFLCVIAQEIGDVEIAPQGILHGVGQLVEQQQTLDLALLALNILIGLQLSALQHVRRRLEEVLEELALPGIPDFRAGAADVGDREQVQRDEAPLGADDVGEAPDNVGVEQVLLLRDRRHGEMVLDQEYDQVRIVVRQAVLAAKAPGIDLAQLRMVSPAALGNVMEDCSDVEEPMALEACHQTAAKGIFVRELQHGEAPQVAYHGKNVLIDRVDVKEVVLHLTDDPAERRQISAQDPVLIHAPQLVHDTARLLQ